MSRSPGVVHTDKVLDVLAGGGAPSDLSASWRRSGHLHALDPASRLPSHRLGQAEIAAAQQRLGEFLKVAQSTLDRLFLAVGGVGCSVLLADRDGVVVDRRGAGADDTTFDAWGLWTGAVWSEKYEGPTASAPASSRSARCRSTASSTSSPAIRPCSAPLRRSSMSMASLPPRSMSPPAGQT